MGTLELTLGFLDAHTKLARCRTLGSTVVDPPTGRVEAGGGGERTRVTTRRCAARRVLHAVFRTDVSFGISALL